MSIIRTKKSSQTPYVLLDTTAMNDPRLSFRAKGLHAYLMSKPDGWQVHIKHLEHVSKEGRDAISVALTELAQTGYLHRERVRGADGRLTGWQTTIYETPQPAPEEPNQQGSQASKQCAPSSPKTDFPSSVSPSSVSPSSVNPHLVSIDGSSKALNEEKTPTPMNGEQKNVDLQSREQNAETRGEHNVCSRDESSMAHVPYMVTPPSGSRAEGTNPRAQGTNPRALGTSPRQVTQAAQDAAKAACPYCDAHDMVDLLHPDGTHVALRCKHTSAHILDYLAAHADLTWPHAPTTSPEGATHAPWTHHPPDGPPHAPGAPHARGLAARHQHAGGPGPAGPDAPAPGGRPADWRDCRHGRDQSPVCLQVGGAVSGGWPAGPGRSATPQRLPWIRARDTAGRESRGDDAGREGRAKSPEIEPVVASVQSGATTGRLPSAPAVDPGATDHGPAP